MDSKYIPEDGDARLYLPTAAAKFNDGEVEESDLYRSTSPMNRGAISSPNATLARPSNTQNTVRFLVPVSR